ncbi:hypothetical protein ACHQM5_011291 [Ranunculus cassubicifolius]
MPNREIAEWIPPPPGWIKINFDSSFQVHKRKGYAAAVCRDTEGRVLGAISKKIIAQNVDEAEAQAAELGCLNII